MTDSAERQPVLYMSHGAPILADDRVWPGQLAAWSAELGKPRNILMVSAHWEAAPITISSTRPGTGLLYDFWGFPDKYYEVTYEPPVATELATEVASILGPGLHQDQSRGLDHGAYVPLMEMYPDEDVPVLQLSLPTLDPARLFEIGKLLAPLRDAGTLIVGSGFTTHNLRWFNPYQGPDAPAPTASSEFDHWAAEAVATKDVDALLTFAKAAPAAREAHPRSEHWVPLYVAMGAAAHTGLESTTAIDGFWYGLSKRSWQFA